MANIIFVKLYTFKKRIATILNYEFKGCMKGIIVLVNKLGRLITNCMGKETKLNLSHDRPDRIGFKPDP